MQIAFQDICKSFHTTQVLHNITFSIESGDILALLGENGAGKSTLMNLLGGLFSPDKGAILLDGAPVHFQSPTDSIAHGIAFIHQELNPVNDLRVYENLFLGQELRKGLLLNRTEMIRQAAAILDSLGIDIDAQAEMRHLNASQKQIVEISRALLCKAKLIIMDEPTTSLAEHEIALLFSIIRDLAQKNVSVIFISHKLNEVKELCKHYVVLRNGHLVASGTMKDVEPQELSEQIVGHELAHANRAQETPLQQVVLELQNFSHPPFFGPIDFQLHAGEILGVTGLLGDGRSELFRSVIGDLTGATGTLLLQKTDATPSTEPLQPFTPRSTMDAVQAGLAYVPSNRKENAIIPDLDVRTNSTLVTLKDYQRYGFLQTALQQQAFQEKAQDFHIKYHAETDLITSLSGGNQQKVILARWLMRRPKVLILDNPTQGVDIGAKQEIYELIRDIASQGVAVVVLSGDSQEIIRLCPRTLVMFHGRIAGTLAGNAITEQAIMALSTGLKL